MISDTPAASSSNSKPVTKSSSKKIEASVLSEEDQLLLAIQNSLRETSSDSTENSPTNELNGDSNDVDDGGDDGVIEIGFESDSDVVEVKGSTSQSSNDYLGDEKDPKAKLILRLPDGNKEMLEWPCSTKLKALKLWCMDKYPEITKDSFKLICPFPRQDILELNPELTLKSAQLYPTVTLHLHQDE